MDVTMPQLGETVTEGTITRWLKQVGEHVDADEPLFEVSTDKVDSEVPAPSGGVITEILVPEGETVEVGTRLAVVSDAAAPRRARARPPAETPAAADRQPPAADRRPPRLRLRRPGTGTARRRTGTAPAAEPAPPPPAPEPAAEAAAGAPPPAADAGTAHQPAASRARAR